MKNITQKTVPFALWLGALALRKSFDLSCFIAPNFIIVTPLLGSFLSAPSICGTFAALTALKLFLGSIPVTLGIPTMLATLSWTTASTNKSSSISSIVLDVALHLLLPLACIGLFITHTGNGAGAYAFYWFIPMIAWALRYTTTGSHSFIVALQSTFIAHATGSIIWLFTMPMTSEQWLALIPLVAVERLTIAASSALLYEMGRICMTHKKTPRLFSKPERFLLSRINNVFRTVGHPQKEPRP